VRAVQEPVRAPQRNLTTRSSGGDCPAIARSKSDERRASENGHVIVRSQSDQRKDREAEMQAFVNRRSLPPEVARAVGLPVGRKSPTNSRRSSINSSGTGGQVGANSRGFVPQEDNNTGRRTPVLCRSVTPEQALAILEQQPTSRRG